MQQSRQYNNQAHAAYSGQQAQYAYASPPPPFAQAYNPHTAWNPPPPYGQQYQPFEPMGPVYHIHADIPRNTNFNYPQNDYGFDPYQQAQAQHPDLNTQENNTQHLSKKRKHKKYTIADHLDDMIKDWTNEELNFSMNKISMAGLIFGLMFLGSIFFLIGFLVAVNLYDQKPDPLCPQPRIFLPSNGAMLSGQVGVSPMASNMPMTQRLPTPAHNTQNMHSTRMPSHMQ
ncbi:MAG: hypothetical protein Q8K36_01235, partial [Alphaproteobacteria bacterium]|nr:hypothetical protein [Alphaproteobacteria bacterium]